MIKRKVNAEICNPAFIKEVYIYYKAVTFSKFPSGNPMKMF